MTVLGYQIGRINCRAAFTADFEVSRTIPLQSVITRMDSDRLRMDVRQGMRSKHVPLRFDPATGAHQIGGRYLFETWDDVVDYEQFTTDELEFEPGVKFWQRAYFSRIDKHAWHVVGAHDFTPVTTHYAHRFERFTYDTATPERELDVAWRSIRDAAQAKGVASIWLLLQPAERQIGVVTMVMQQPSDDDAAHASQTLAALERSASLSRHVSRLAGARKVFDRTSINLSLWLPWSRRLGGDPTVFPTYPVHPLP